MRKNPTNKGSNYPEAQILDHSFFAIPFITLKQDRKTHFFRFKKGLDGNGKKREGEDKIRNDLL